LKSDWGDDKALLKDGIEIIETESDRLTRMVDELLDFSKLNNGRISLCRTPLHVAEFLRHIGKQLAPRAARQGISLNVQVDGSIPVIQADENRLKQVLINLIDNSLKFTGSNGTIKVHSRCKQGQVIITVEDTGAGIPEQDLPHVFQKFYKGDSQAAGSGLGLSIAEQIIKLHGGQLSINSREGAGTTVEIALPV